MSSSTQTNTIRLLMPQWQGGDYSLKPSTGEIYQMGARLLAFLAPQSDAPLIEVPISPDTGEEIPIQNGVAWQEIILKQLKATQAIIEEHKPDRIITFGGDCLVSQAPFAYLNERYQGNVGILWIDAHPDISTPDIFNREHAMVLGNLLGAGDPVFSKEVKKPFTKEQALLLGMDQYNSTEEKQIVEKLGLKMLPLADLANNHQAVSQWVTEHKFEQMVIHVDLDVLDPKYFYSQLTRTPYEEPFDTVTGKLTMAQLTQIIKSVADISNVVGISFTEHMPWDAINLKNMMNEFAFMK